MAAEIRLTRRFQKSFEKLDKRVGARVREAIGKLADDPFLGKPLRGELAGEWSLRVGEHRVLYVVEEGVVWIETVRHRREAYR